MRGRGNSLRPSRRPSLALPGKYARIARRRKSTMADGAVVNVAPEKLPSVLSSVVLNSSGLIDTAARKTAVAHVPSRFARASERERSRGCRGYRKRDRANAGVVARNSRGANRIAFSCVSHRKLKLFACRDEIKKKEKNGKKEKKEGEAGWKRKDGGSLMAVGGILSVCTGLSTSNLGRYNSTLDFQFTERIRDFDCSR